MNDLEIIVKQITNTFEKNLFSLALKNQYHWSTRKYRIDPQDKYLQSIWTNFQIRSLTMVPRISQTDFLKNPKKIGRRILENYSTNTEKKKSRFICYVENPEIIYYFGVIHYLFLTKSYNMDKLSQIKEIYKKGSEILKKADFEKLFLNKNLVLANPSAVANNIYYLKYLDVVNLEKKLLEFYKNFWLEFRPQNEIEWQNKVYALTHVIIASSYFYQQKVEREKVEWILAFFDENIEEIIKNTNSDIISEVALCFKLCNIKTHLVIDKVVDILKVRFNSELGFIPREDGVEKLEKLEHRNIVAVLLMSHWRKLNPGPDLYKFMIENKKTFYIPRRGIHIGPESIED